MINQYYTRTWAQKKHCLVGQWHLPLEMSNLDVILVCWHKSAASAKGIESDPINTPDEVPGLIQKAFHFVTLLARL